MIITQVRFHLSAPISLEDATAKFRSTAPKYEGHPGLIRKCYVRSEDGQTVGAFYFWETRAAAEATYTDAWKAMVTETYGAAPDITFYDSPVQVENT